MTKYNKHQLSLIFFMAFVGLYLFSAEGQIIGFTQFTNLLKESLVLLICFIFITTLGVSHGALDGKIIWDQGGNSTKRLKIYSTYITITLVGGLLWVIYPFVGLLLLLMLSIIHFGLSDLKFLGKISQLQKISWGFIMTFLPLGFHENEVNEIFYLLTDKYISGIFMVAIKYLLLTAVFLYFSIVFKKIFSKKNTDILSESLVSIELGFLVVMAYLLDPIVWFALYFCTLHGLRSIIQLNFKFYPDTIWMIFFTSPIIIFILLAGNNYNQNDIFIVFPILACLTNAHMLLPNIIKKVKD